MNDIRFIFSALTDADFIQTEAHFEGQTPEQLGRDQGPPLNAARILEAVDAEIARARTGRSSEPVRLLRHETLADCTAASSRPPGLFLSHRTYWIRKTLAALRFAFAHAAKHNLRRIVYVSPYLTIFDQTVELLSHILLQAGMSPSERQRYLLEHASLTRLDAEIPEQSTRLEDSDHEGRLRLQARLSENWDAPFIATTNVQLLESLFSNRSSKCRKLHRLAGSVIVLDEVQTLPMELACATLATLSRLAEEPFGCTLLFMTATQPAFTELDPALKEHWKEGWRPTEITTDVPRKFALAKRFRVSWPRTSDGEMPWFSLANDIANLPSPRQALVIVNVKRHAAELLASLPEEIEARHLSTSMCPRHRKDVLADINRDFTGGRDCILVEPSALSWRRSGLPSSFSRHGAVGFNSQAAGRCNRHGNRESGDFPVFEPPDDALPPDRGYKVGTASTRAILAANCGIDLDDPLIFHNYYSRLCTTSHDSPDQKVISLKPSVIMIFREFGTLPIDRRQHVQVVFRTMTRYSPPWRPNSILTASLQLGFAEPGLIPLTISRVGRRSRELLCTNFHSIGKAEIFPDWFLLGNPDHYDSKKKRIGLMFPKPGDFFSA